MEARFARNDKRRITFTVVMPEFILEEGEDESAAIEERIERNLPPGAMLVEWHFE
jgi:hypothetical protein